MKKNNARRVRLNPRAPLVIVFLMITIVIAIIVVMFFVFVKDDINRLDLLSAKYADGSQSLQPTSSEENSTSGTNENVSGDVNSELPTSSTLPPVDPLSTVVAESASVDKSYFDDAVFIGDSISKGLKVYGVLPPGNVIADQNVGIPTIAANKPAYMNTAGKKITLDQALNSLSFKPTKVYVMLGLNGLPYYSNSDHIPYYYTVIQYLKTKYPNATIYVESVTPITAGAEVAYAKKKQDFTNKKILEFNELIKQMCVDEKVFYLNVKDVLVDEKGELKANIASTDGFHFIKAGHEAVYQYFKTHTVPKVLVNEE